MRDILLFPKINNIESIQKTRLKYDRLANKLNPHITIIFPFEDDISDEELYNQLLLITKDIECFKISLKGISLTNDNYAILKVKTGSDKIKKLHDCIYNKLFPEYWRKDIKYIPHITLGQVGDIKEFDCFDINLEFNGIVDSLFIERIGSNEESIIVKEIKFNEHTSKR